MIINTLDKSIEIAIPNSNKKIGMMLSGGMDSALLGYLLLKEIKEQDLSTSILFFNIPRNFNNTESYAKRIIEYYEKVFNKQITLMSIGQSELEDSKQLKYGYKLAKTKVDTIFSGSNAIPPVDIGVVQQRRSNINYENFPFRNLYKTHILEIYKQLNILDLAYISQSCGDNRNTQCNVCFHCKERQWAFDCLNIENKFIPLPD